MYISRLRLLLLVVLVALVCLGGGIALGRYYLPNVGPWEVALEEARADAEGQYYRGMFDLWKWVGKVSGQQLDPLAFVKRAHDLDWYGQPSSGWDWPLD